MIAKLWPGVSVAIIALLLFLWLRSGCNKVSIPDTTQIAMKAIKAGYDSAQRRDTPIIRLLNKKSDSISLVLAGERKLREVTEMDLQVKASNLRKTLASLNRSKETNDTANRLRQGDSLEAQVIAGIPSVEGFEHITDSMINSCEAQVSVKDSIILLKNKLLHIADTTITVQQLQYQIIHADDIRKTRQLKFYKPAAKIGIGIVIGASVLHFLLK